MGVVTTIFHEFRLVSEQQTEGFRTWGVDYYHILGSRTIVRPVGINTEGWTALEILNEFPAQLSSNRHFPRHFFQTLVPLYSSWTVSFSVERTEQYSTGKMNVQFAFLKSVFSFMFSILSVKIVFLFHYCIFLSIYVWCVILRAVSLYI